MITARAGLFRELWERKMKQKAKRREKAKARKRNRQKEGWHRTGGGGRTENKTRTEGQKTRCSWGAYKPNDPDFDPRPEHPSWKEGDEEMERAIEEYERKKKDKSKAPPVLSVPDGYDDSDSDDTFESRGAARRRMNHLKF